MSHGLYVSANYTLAKNLADNQDDSPTACAGEVNYGVPIAKGRQDTEIGLNDRLAKRRNRNAHEPQSGYAFPGALQYGVLQLCSRKFCC
jgi:hypothetical protein